MRRIVISTSIIFFVFTSCLGQVALLDKVYDFIQSNDLQKAEAAILIAEKNVLTANDARTHYLKSFIYKELFMKADSGKRDQLRNTSITSMNRCKYLDHDESFKQPLKQLYDFLTASIYNDGSDSYNNQNYQSAIDLFKYFIKLSQANDGYWLDANYFIGSSYYNLHILDSASVFFEFVKDKNYEQPLLFLDLSYLFFNLKKEQKAIETISRGLLLYPDYLDLQIAEFNILAGFGKYSDLEIKLEEFLTKNATNIEVLLMASTTYEKNKTEETRPQYLHKAEKVLRKVIELDPTNFDANYNLGVLFYNEAVDIVNKSELDTDVAELTKILELSTKLFEKSLPLLRTIFDSRNSNKKLLQALQAIYYNLNMKKELNEINALLKEVDKN
jgi:tetratricopeptide (TPR) repeat protein